jgi:hydroxyquinol 1,2-dioxygenase
MKRLNEINITEEAQSRLAATPDRRLKEIMIALTRHLHDFGREVRLTPVEWKAGIDFLTKVGQLSDDKRQEFILLSDIMGLSALVDLIAHANANEQTTASSLLGPFYRAGVPELKNGTNIAADGAGEPLIVRGKVLDADAEPIAGAIVDVWQNASNGLYDVQDPNQPEINMRGRLRTDDQGQFTFRTTKPISYSVPTDGPVGQLLQREGRHSYRPAHIHFMLSAQGYQTLITALYIAGDRYLDSDAVFGAKDELVVGFAKGAADGIDSIDFNFVLSSLT